MQEDLKIHDTRGQDYGDIAFHDRTEKDGEEVAFSISTAGHECYQFGAEAEREVALWFLERIHVKHQLTAELKVIPPGEDDELNHLRTENEKLHRELGHVECQLRNKKHDLEFFLDEDPEYLAGKREWRVLMDKPTHEMSKEERERLSKLTNDLLVYKHDPDPAERWSAVRAENEKLRAEVEKLKNNYEDLSVLFNHQGDNYQREFEKLMEEKHALEDLSENAVAELEGGKR